jgi:polyhydroxybutyrate depolymerase
MKFFRSLLAAILLATTAHASDATYWLGMRNYTVHTPPGKGPFPVVVNLHGGGSNPKIQAVQSGMNANADRNHYAVVYPCGTGGAGQYTWNAGLCCGFAMQHNVDDVGFIGRVLDDLPSHVAIDDTRIYATGMSNGAMMAYRLAVESPERFAAIGAVSTTMGVDVHLPHPPMPIIEIHGLKDPNAPFNGGVGPNAQPQPGGPPVHHAVMDTVAQWAAIDGYPAPAPFVADKGVFTHRVYAGTKATFELYALRDGGHTWPGGVDVTPNAGTGELVKTFNANQYQWEFFSRWRRTQ